MATISKCRKCGKRSSKYSDLCRSCSRESHRQATEAAQAVVAKGKCPDCGRKLRRNSALPGWWQCEQYGAPQYRTDPEAPSCPFQCFTE